MNPLRSQWKREAAKMLAENRQQTGRFHVSKVAAKVRKTRVSVYRLVSELRETHRHLAS